MKSIKTLFIIFALIFFQKGYSQNENLGHQQTYHFTQQVDNKNIELVIIARPGNFLGGETFFHFKLDKIIIHTWEIDGVLYDRQNSNGVLPASGELGHAYIDVKISTVAKNIAHNKFWEKKGFQINKMTDFQDIDYDERKDVWLTYAYVWACTIKSVHISDWFEIQQKIKGNKATTSSNNSSSSNNNITKNNIVTNTSNADVLSNKLDALVSDPNFIQNNPQLIQQISKLMRTTDFDNEASVNHYVEEAERIVNNYVGNNSNTSTTTRNSASNQIQQVAKEMNLRSDEVEILEIFNSSTNLNEAYSKLKAKNIQNLNKYTLDALNKIVGDNNAFSITGSDIQSLLNGSSLTDVLKNVNLRQSNKIAQDLGLDYSQTQVLNIIATSGNKEEMTERLKQHNIQQISETTLDSRIQRNKAL